MIEVRELRGVGIGTGVVVGPVLHVARQAAAVPTDTPSTIGADAELARAREALAAVSGQLRERAANADEATRDVLEAQALMTDDPALLDSFVMEGKAPRSVMVVTIEKVFFQCARAVMRADIWNPSKHPPRDQVPTPGQILSTITDARVGGKAYDEAWLPRAKESMW